MLWRVVDPDPRGDGDWIRYQDDNDWMFTLNVPLSMEKKFDKEMEDWIFDLIMDNDSRFDMAAKVLPLYQSFLLDYIEYLIESSIDRQIASETPLIRCFWTGED